MSFSAAACALEGVRVVRSHPVAFLVWSLLYLAFAVAGAWVVFQVSGPAILAILTGKVGMLRPAAIEGLMPALYVLYPMILALTAVFDAAVFRAVLRPEQKGVAYLALGPDELRLFAVGVLGAVAGFVLQLAADGLGQIVSGTGAAAPLLKFVVGAAYWSVNLWVAVRLCLWAPHAFAEGRLDVGGAWRLTAGRFWLLVALFLLLIAIGLGSLVTVILAAVAIGGGWGALVAVAGARQGGSDMGLAAFTVIGALDTLYLMAVVFMLTLFAAAFAAAYRSLAVGAEAQSGKIKLSASQHHLRPNDGRAQRGATS